MKKLLLLTTSPTVGGNGDALMQAAAETAKECGAEIQRIDVRDLTIQPCKSAAALREQSFQTFIVDYRLSL